MKAWTGVRTEGRLPRQRYVWSNELREAYREIVKMQVDRDPRRQYGWGTFFVWGH